MKQPQVPPSGITPARLPKGNQEYTKLLLSPHDEICLIAATEALLHRLVWLPFVWLDCHRLDQILVALCLKRS